MRRMLLAALLILIVATPPAAASTAGTSSAAVLRDQRTRLQRLLDRLTRSKVRLREVRREERRVLSELEDIDRSQEATEQRLQELAREMAGSRTAAQAIATRLAVTERRLAEHRARLRGRLRTVYMYGRTGYVDVLLGADDVREFVTRWHFVSTIVRADGRIIREYAEDVEEHRALIETLRQEQARLAAVSAETAARQREVEAREQAKRSAHGKAERVRSNSACGRCAAM